MAKPACQRLLRGRRATMTARARNRKADGMADKTSETMGERILHLCEVKGLTQSDLARQLAVSRVTVHQWCTDKSQPRNENLLMIAALLGTSPQYIVFGPSRQPPGGFPAEAADKGRGAGSGTYQSDDTQPNPPRKAMARLRNS